MARYHFARHRTPHLRREDLRPGRLELSNKPEGLWYSLGDAWPQFVTPTNPRYIGRYVYAVTLQRGAVLRIRSWDALARFARAYGERRVFWNGTTSSRYDIDWPRVARTWGGIEIAPFQWRVRERAHTARLAWHRTWDVASGCIWDPAAMTDLTLAAERVIVR